MPRSCSRRSVRRACVALLVACPLLIGSSARTAAQDVKAAAPSTPRKAIAIEQALAAGIDETRMVKTVRRLVGFGPRMYGTPSNHEAAAWLAASFREAGLEVTVRKDSPRDWYQPIAWAVRAVGGNAPVTSTIAPRVKADVLETTWPSSGSPSAKGEGTLSIDAAPGAVCLVSKNPTPDTTAGCVAVLFDGRASVSGWPGVGRLRGTWTIPVFGVSPREATRLRERVAEGEQVRIAFSLEAKSGNDPADTVVATLPGKDRTKYLLFCAHGDSDSGGPGANDNASGVAIVLEVARAAAAAVRAGTIPQPAWDIRFVSWGGEIASTREYVTSMDGESSRLQAVINYDQSGFGSWKDALYVEPDDTPANHGVIAVVRSVMTDHLGAEGFSTRAASIRSQGGTDSYVFQPRTQGATVYPAVTLYTSAWDRERAVPVTEGFPPLNWYPGETPGMITVDGDAFYHSVGDTPANTTDTEPSNMGWCARVGLLSALRLMSAR
ncbi:MAG: M28 family peptidase [Acidobacteria bacterium]|nr:M28 family peptidase [Acidobacteriota bacterium]